MEEEGRCCWGGVMLWVWAYLGVEVEVENYWVGEVIFLFGLGHEYFCQV